MNDTSDDDPNPNMPQLEDPSTGTSTNCDTGLQEDDRTGSHERTTAPLWRKMKMMMLQRKTTILIHGEKPLCHLLLLCRVTNSNA